MTRLLFSLLLLLFPAAAFAYDWQKDGSGYVRIMTAEDLKAFAAEVNAGHSDLCAVLEADIRLNPRVIDANGALVTDATLEEWTPIGTVEHPFTGNFDGDGHTISGIYIKTSGFGDYGLFGRIAGHSRVYELLLTDSYIECTSNMESSIGGICGQLRDEAYIEFCGVQATIKGSGKAVTAGGIAGSTFTSEGPDAAWRPKIYSSYSFARVSAAGQHKAGGIVGLLQYGSLWGDINCATLTTEYVGTSQGSMEDGVHSLTFEDFASGRVCWMMNSCIYSTQTHSFYQSIGTDPAPHFGDWNNRVFPRVYPQKNCRGEAVGFFNDQETAAIIVHTPYETEFNEEGYACHLCQEKVQRPEQDAEGYYLISLPGHLCWVLQQTDGNTKARLVNDIVVNHHLLNADGTLNERNLARIWYDYEGFGGELLGDGHVVSGIYAHQEYGDGFTFHGLLGSTQKVLIERLGIVDSYFYDYAIAPLAHRMAKGSVVRDCYAMASIKAATCAGLVYDFSGESIQNCWHTGDLLPYSNSTQEHHYFGIVHSGDEVTINSFTTLPITFQNQWYGNHTEVVTLDQMASGEITWRLNGSKLGATWRQTIEGEASEPFPSFTSESIVKYNPDEDFYFNTTLCNGEIRDHAIAFEGRLDPTCTHDGHEAHWYCTLCNKEFSDCYGSRLLDSSRLPALTTDLHHNFKPVASTYDCLTGGYTAHYKCEVCHELFATDLHPDMDTDKRHLDDFKKQPTGAHDKRLVTGQTPTCFRGGLQDHYRCEGCHKIYRADHPDAVIDDLEELQVGPMATKRSEHYLLPTHTDGSWATTVEWKPQSSEITLGNVQRANVGAAKQVLRYVVPANSSSAELFYYPESLNGTDYPTFTLVVSINGKVFEYVDIDRDAEDNYDILGSLPFFTNTHDGDIIEMVVMGVNASDAGKAAINVTFSATTVLHNLVSVRGHYNCLTGGEADYYHCTICQHDYDTADHPWNDADERTTGLSREAIGRHSALSHVDEVLPTCGDHGTDGYWVCGVCNQWLTVPDHLDSSDYETDADHIHHTPATGDHRFTIISSPSVFDGLSRAQCEVCLHYDEAHRYIMNGIGDRNIRLSMDNLGNYFTEDELIINDGESYHSPVDYTAPRLTYTRTFPSRFWYPLFVPFDMDHDDWAQVCDIAELENVHQYTDDDGDIVKTTLEYIRITEGGIEGGTPYVIRPKQASDAPISITIDGAKLKRSDNRATPWCASFKRRYQFYGTYDRLDNIYDMYYIAGDGMLYHDNTGIALRPGRWYIDVTDRTGSPLPMAEKPALITLELLGDDTEADVSGIRVIETEYADDCVTDGVIYTLDGRRIHNGGYSAPSVKIINGKKEIR